MFRLRADGRTLFDLMQLRVEVRRQVFLLQSALRDVQTELRGWARHRAQEAAAGRQVPRELASLWEELAARERELAMDLVLVQGSLEEIARAIDGVLRRRGASAGSSKAG